MRLKKRRGPDREAVKANRRKRAVPLQNKEKVLKMLLKLQKEEHNFIVCGIGYSFSLLRYKYMPMKLSKLIIKSNLFIKSDTKIKFKSRF